MIRNVLIPSLILAAACGDNGGDDLATGTVTATVYGEEFIEEGIPADVFVDGWALQYDKFLVSIGSPKARSGTAAPVGPETFFIVDLSQPSGGEGYELETFDVPGGDYDHYEYRLSPNASATSVNADPADVTEMTASGFSVWVQGVATKGAESIAFDWAFELDMAYSGCEMSDTIDGNDVTMQSTIHSDHLFYDDAVSDEPAVAFQIFADSDGADGSTPDGIVTFAELAAKDITAETRYQVGSNTAPDGSAIENLLQYLEFQATTLGHINGEGHCEEVDVSL